MSPGLGAWRAPTAGEWLESASGDYSLDQMGGWHTKPEFHQWHIIHERGAMVVRIRSWDLAYALLVLVPVATLGYLRHPMTDSHRLACCSSSCTVGKMGGAVACHYHPEFLELGHLRCTDEGLTAETPSGV